MSLRLGVLATHPIQYFSPLYRRLAGTPGVAPTVYYAHRPTAAEQGIGFGVPFEWDVDLLSGYDHRFLANVAARPGTEHFAGCDTPEIAEVIRRERFDAFLVMGWQVRSYWQAMLACHRSGTPVLVRSDSQLPTDRNPWKRTVKRALYPRFLGRVAAGLATGTRSAEYLRYYGAPRVVRSPHFVDNARFRASAETARVRRAELRRGWGIPDDAFVLLFAGKLVPKKRPLDVVRAVAQHGGRDVRVLVAGEGELRRELEREAERLGVGLHVAGFMNQSRIAEAYAASDALVLPSDARETWGLVVNEAMASGLPVLVSRDAGCSVDLVDEGRTGHAFDCGDVAGLSRLVAALAADPARVRAMGDAASAHIEAYSVEAAADGVLEGCDAGVPA